MIQKRRQKERDTGKDRQIHAIVFFVVSNNAIFSLDCFIAGFLLLLFICLLCCSLFVFLIIELRKFSLS